jgi:AraC-like DNA-binding protein
MPWTRGVFGVSVNGDALFELTEVLVSGGSKPSFDEMWRLYQDRQIVGAQWSMAKSELSILWIDCAEDNPATELREATSRTWKIRTAGPGDAERNLDERLTDVVVFDFARPSRTDLALLRSVKRRYSTVPILMLTEEHSEQLAVWAFRARVWNYFSKPVTLREFSGNLNQIAKVLRQRGASSRQPEFLGALLPERLAGQAPAIDVMERVAEALRQNYAHRLRAADLAREFHLSRFQFSRLFKRRFGHTFRDYLTRVRIASARRLLGTQRIDNTVTAVGMLAGYQDPSYFARAYRRHTGESPSAYARRIANARAASAPAPPLDPDQDFQERRSRLRRASDAPGRRRR